MWAVPTGCFAHHERHNLNFHGAGDALALVLTPEQRLQSLQVIHPEVNVLGVVALFRKPAERRWRLVFDLQQAAREGIVLGANACALSVTSGLNGLDGAGLPWRLLSTRCP